MRFRAPITCLKFSPDGRYLAVAHSNWISVWRSPPLVSNGVFSLFRMPTFEVIHSLAITNSDISACAINSQGEWLAFASSNKGQLFIWEWRSETFVMKQQGHFSNINSICFSADGQLLATGADDGKLKIWNASNGFCFLTFADHSAAITRVEFARNNVLIITASLDGTCRVYDLVRYLNFRTLVPPSKDDYQRFLSALEDKEQDEDQKKLLQRKLQSGVPLQTARFISLAVDDSAEIICAGSEDPFEIYVWSLRSGQCLDVLCGHEGPISSLAFSSANRQLASGSWDCTLRLWSLYSKHCATEVIDVQSAVLDIDFRADGKELCLCTLHGQIQVYDAVDGRHLRSIDIKKDVLGANQSREKFRAEKNQSIGHYSCICYSPDGQLILAGGRSKYIGMYYVPHSGAQALLLSRHMISLNRDMEGVAENPSARKRRKTMDMDVYTASNVNERMLNRNERQKDRDIIRLKRRELPGVEITDYSSRRRRAVLATKDVRFSLSAMMWAAATVDGVLIYSQAQLSVFDPFDLDVDATPMNIEKELVQCYHRQTTNIGIDTQPTHDASYLRALIMSLKLNDIAWIQKVLEQIPHERIPICVKNIPPKYLGILMRVLSESMSHEQPSQLLQFYLLWINRVLIIHGSFLKQHFAQYLQYFRLLHKNLSTIHSDIEPICNGNIHKLQFLASFHSKENDHSPRKKLPKIDIEFAAIETKSTVVQPKESMTHPIFGE